MKTNPLLALHEFGQSVWLDYIRRGMLCADGELQQFITRDGVRGVTSNPAIFEKAIGQSSDYQTAIRALVAQGKPAEEIGQTLMIEDVGRAADILRPLYDQSDGGDGFVSIEVSPTLAHDTPGTLAQARQLWNTLGRPNVMIKVPATGEGLPAIEQLIGDGINVNITLLFAVSRYEEVARAYIGGLEKRAAAGLPIERVASVASFFVSRIDTLLDPRLASVIQLGSPKAEIARPMLGQLAIDNARVAYQTYKTLCTGSRWQAISQRGARPQRLLWASTGTKNPKYSDVMYVESLIGPETVNTIPVETLEAYRTHGEPAVRLEDDLAGAERRLAQLPELGIDLAAATQQLEDEGVQKFVEPFEKLMATLRGFAKWCMQ